MPINQNEIPEIRLYRLIKAFSELHALRLIAVDRACDIDPTHLDAAEDCLLAVQRRLASSPHHEERNLAAALTQTLSPHWSKS